jgi:DNA-binding response OmpR family regulator
VRRLPRPDFKAVAGLRISQIVGMDPPPDVVLLDCDTVDNAVVDYCRRLRQVSDAPIVAVTRHVDTSAWLLGHDAGIDDFLVDPFHPEELATRLRLAVRPTPVVVANDRRTRIVYGPLEIVDQTRSVAVLGVRVDLRPKEYQLLLVLARHGGQTLTRDQLIAQLWPFEWEGAKRTLEVHIASLRAKLAVPGLIATMRGVGYRLISQESYVQLDPPSDA